MSFLASPTKSPAHIAVIGAGWAGCAAAVRATQLGARVTVFETSRIAGGRARSVPWAEAPDGALDNGQHILIGAYSETLTLMQTVGADVQNCLQRLPLDLRTHDGNGMFLPVSPRFPELAVLRAIVQAKGWGFVEKLQFLSTVARWQLQGFNCASSASVSDICRGMAPQIMNSLIEPLCVAAFNSAPAETSGAVFLRVLHDALLTEKGASDVLLSRVPFGQLVAEPSLKWLAEHGARVFTGQRVAAIRPIYSSDPSSAANGSQQWQVISTQAESAEERYSHVVLACPAWEAARLVQECFQPMDTFEPLSENPKQALNPLQWAAQANALQHRPIATVYAWCPQKNAAHLPPMQALYCHSADEAQFAFCHHHRQNADGDVLMAFVASHCSHDRQALSDAASKQAQEQLGIANLTIIQTFIEKRATFLCAPQVQRPIMRISNGLLACGDYVQGDYPATLEGAVRSGLAAANAVFSH